MLAAGFTIAPLATAWALHNVGIIPLIKWVQELQVPKETATWGHALARSTPAQTSRDMTMAHK